MPDPFRLNLRGAFFFSRVFLFALTRALDVETRQTRVAPFSSQVFARLGRTVVKRDVCQLAPPVVRCAKSVRTQPPKAPMRRMVRDYPACGSLPRTFTPSFCDVRARSEHIGPLLPVYRIRSIRQPHHQASTFVHSFT